MGIAATTAQKAKLRAEPKLPSIVKRTLFQSVT